MEKQRILLKNAQIMDPRNHFEEILDLYLEEGKIKNLGKNLDIPDAEVLDLTGKWIVPGFVDVHVHLRDPGFPQKETMETACRSALGGGFTHLLAMANTKPVMDSPEEIETFYKKAQSVPVNVYTVSALTKDLKGKTLVDMEACAKAGALGFSDDGFPLVDLALLKEAMEKARELNLPLSFHEEDPSLIGTPGINEGNISREMGLKGAPAYSEYSYIGRDCALALDWKTKVDIQHISTKAGASLVALFYDLGANVLGEITPHHFSFTEEKIRTHGTMAKMNPPLRTEEDRLGLQDLFSHPSFVLATDHAPHTEEEKSVEFSKAPSGILGLEIAFAAALRHLVKEGKVSLKDLIEKMTYLPAAFYNMEYDGIQERKIGNFSIVDPEEKWTVTRDTFKGKSYNSPYEGEEYIGKIKYTVSKGELFSL
ncbi:dihydroorotase [Peptoniphilus sp. KCTC 25270]|uniref:dihydroorotase n=1 Tax=Peptoniphilus sp. KCTC 25270 TaxID=2897414 RepID=UPI001E3328FC|nr:dihydroorotase [Peptoniphilus sp. KCTC 25270]MCD1147594.1 dihydroorotase [Peptoniphilus sp. KCTC 25270]